MTTHSLVFVHLGGAVPAYALDALQQARLFNACPAYLIAQESALADFKLDAGLRVEPVACESLPLSDKQRHFRAAWKAGYADRHQFWMFAIERFFYLEQFMIQRQTQNVFHLENDVILYADLEALAPIFQSSFPGLASTLDN